MEKINNSFTPDLPAIIAEFILIKRTQLKITQGYMADKMHLSQSAYCKTEKGYHPFTLNQIEIAAKEFGLSCPEFFMKAFSRDYDLSQPLSNWLNSLSDKEKKATAERFKKDLLIHSNLLGNTILLLESLSQIDFF